MDSQNLKLNSKEKINKELLDNFRNKEYKEIEKEFFNNEIDKNKEKKLEINEDIDSELNKNSELTGIVGISQNRNKKQKRKEAVEKILEEDLKDIYLGMPIEKQRKFKIAGEETANEINNLLNKTKVNVKKIINLIKKWLLIIPGVNKFFLEQEAKIKADKILKTKELEFSFEDAKS